MTVATTSTIPTTCVVHAAGVAARSTSAGGVVPDASVAVGTSMAMRVVRFCVRSGTALGFELMPCDVVCADFNTSSSPQFMCLAYRARDTRIEEDALYQGRCDERCVLKATFSRSSHVAGVWDKSLGGIVECGTGAKERLHAPRAKEFRLILECALEEVDGVPERFGLRHAALADHLNMAIVGRNVGNRGTRGQRAKAPNPQDCHDHGEKLRFGSCDGRGKLK